MISLVIKGDRNAAYRAAKRASVPIVCRPYKGLFDETLALTPDANLDLVVVWFLEGTIPARPGDLLHYTAQVEEVA